MASSAQSWSHVVWQQNGSKEQTSSQQGSSSQNGEPLFMSHGPDPAMPQSTNGQVTSAQSVLSPW